MMKYGKKGKRSAPKRHNLWSLSHSFIYYDGWYFEFGVGKTHKAVYNTRAVKSNRCKSRRDKKPAGYSTLSVECLKKCTKNYKGKYGRYRLLTHNCHHFANRISNILCNWKSCPTSGSKPYYFGTTSLWCMMRNAKKGKRASAPSRSVLRPSHRFIYYQGYYFEFGIGPRDLAVYAKTNAGSPRCSPRREGSPAGYSKLSVECIKRCTRSYERRFGKWRLFTHNCHHFTNNLSKVLCNSRRCPGWCQ
ncbi:hypothetical protein FSP39_017078 [Pinctada imbricata]|uniref:Uncharacterized protein n=1 Tax=Pinctada imbricata TaxID=66713 RepID=A0AA89BT32_PINIB|nr:hypothetical protein FSP39_017078 [Pinctada imbricata]